MNMDRSITFDELMKIRAHRIADRTTDVESFERYGQTRWRACARVLLERKLTEHQVETILRSRWMLVVAEGSTHPYGSATSGDLTRWLDTMTPRQLQRAVVTLKR